MDNELLSYIVLKIEFQNKKVGFQVKDLLNLPESDFLKGEFKLNVDENDVNEIDLGIPFFRKVSVILDFEQNRIGLHSSFEKNGNTVENFLN